MAKVYSSNGVEQDGGNARIIPATSYVGLPWEVTFDLYVPSGQAYSSNFYIVKNGNSTASNYNWVIQINSSGQMKVTQSWQAHSFATLPIVEDTWQTWTFGWDGVPVETFGGSAYASVDGGASVLVGMDYDADPNYQEYTVLQPLVGSGVLTALIRNVDIREGIGDAKEHQVIYLCNEESGAIGIDTGDRWPNGYDLTLYDNGATIHVDDPAGVVHPTFTFFGPVLTTDTEATLKWQWSSTGTDPWYDVDAGVNGLPQYIQYTEVGVEVNGTTQARNQLNIDSATQAQIVYLRCKATTNYEPNGIPSEVSTLTIVEAQP